MQEHKKTGIALARELARESNIRGPSTTWQQDAEADLCEYERRSEADKITVAGFAEGSLVVFLALLFLAMKVGLLVFFVWLALIVIGVA